MLKSILLTANRISDINSCAILHSLSGINGPLETLRQAAEYENLSVSMSATH